jgi:hypothetical protein
MPVTPVEIAEAERYARLVVREAEASRFDAPKTKMLARALLAAVLTIKEQATRSEALTPPTEQEIATYRDKFRSELDLNMNNSSGSPSTDAHRVALYQFVERRRSALVVKLEHVCGLQGFGRGEGAGVDRCPSVGEPRLPSVELLADVLVPLILDHVQQTSGRCALYLRSSKDRHDVSIDAQRRALVELAAAKTSRSRPNSPTPSRRRTTGRGRASGISYCESIKGRGAGTRC